MKTPLKKAKCFTLKSGNNPSGFKMMVAALTGGLDAVYGSGRIMPGTSKKITFAKDDKNAEKNVKTPGEKIINGEDDDKDKNKNKEV